MRKLPKVLSNQEIEKLYDYFRKNQRSKTNLRDQAMVVGMLEYGLRISEVVGIKRCGIEMISGRLQVTGKGKKDRILYIQPQHLQVIKKWLDIRPSSEWLFCAIYNSRGTPGKQLDPRQVREKLYRVGKKISITGLHPHMLRHTFATRLYSRTRNIALVQDVLGHENIATTRIYTHISGADIRDALHDFHS